MRKKVLVIGQWVTFFTNYSKRTHLKRVFEEKNNISMVKCAFKSNQTFSDKSKPLFIQTDVIASRMHPNTM
jgi:hypothetical protein